MFIYCDNKGNLHYLAKRVDCRRKGVYLKLMAQCAPGFFHRMFPHGISAMRQTKPRAFPWKSNREKTRCLISAKK